MYRGWGHGGYYGGYYPGWGWGSGWGWGWGFPGYWGGYYGVPWGYANYANNASGDWSIVKTDVSPEEALLFLDDRYIGLADDFDGYPDFLYLQPGDYHLEFRLEGFETLPVDLKARAGGQFRIEQDMKKIPGAKQYGSYDTPKPEGGVQRFWAKEKQKNAPAAIDVEVGEGYTDSRDPDSGPQAPAAPPAGPSAAPPPAPPTAPSATRARIRFRIEPADAAVYIDDQFAGTARELSTISRGLSVRPGTHRIVVSRPGYESDASQVEAAAGATELVEITLRRP